MALIIVMSNLNDCFAFGFSGSNFLKRLVDVFEREYFIHRRLNLPLCKNLGDTLKTLLCMVLLVNFSFHFLHAVCKCRIV